MDAVEAIRGTRPEYGFERGRCLPDFEFVTIDGVRKRLSDFRGRKNLMVIVAGGHDDGLLNAVAKAYPEVKLHEAHAIAILKDNSPLALRVQRSRPWPFDVVSESGSALQRWFSSGNGRGESGLAVYITDRWAEVVFVCRTMQGDPAPNIAELLGWLTFVDHQCPECFPSEWPA